MTTKSRQTRHVLLLRHGQTDANATGIIQGHSPTPLNALGHAQAQRLATRMAGWTPRVEALVSSDLLRARQTAGPVSAATGLAITFDASWRERKLGEYEGRTVGERETWRLATGDATPPGAESPDEFHTRVRRALMHLPDGFPHSNVIAVITHGGPIRAILRMLADGRLPLHASGSDTVTDTATIANCAVMHLTLDRTTNHAPAWRVHCLNDVRHLDDLATATDAG